MDKETFLKPRLPEADVDIPGVGAVRVRGLSRLEALQIQSGKQDMAALERAVIRLGLVDPALTPDEIDAWYAAAPAGEIVPIVSAIHDLSGLKEGAAKAAYKSDGDLPGS